MILALTVASLAACGQTAAATAPDTLTVTVTTPGSSAARTFTVSDASAVEQIYRYLLALPLIPAQSGPACCVTRQSYRFAFTASGANILADGIAQCANILQMPNNQSRAPDGAF